MSKRSITYYDRYSRQYCVEEIYGEGALRFAYETSFGRGLTWLIFARPFISRLFGWYMNRSRSKTKILPFIKEYGLDPADFKLPPDAFGSFNEFFCRELKEDRRPINTDPESIVFPADGRHMGWQQIGMEQHVFIKGQKWNLEQLLGGDGNLIDRFEGGSMVLSRLCPVDYHHFHYPVEGIQRECIWLGKLLYSVSPIALRHNLSYLWQNKRCLNIIETKTAGACCFIEIGATNVGTIKHRPIAGDGRIAKGQPKGWFEFGGSSVVTIFEKGRVGLSEDLLQFSSKGIELYAKVGDQMGHILTQ